MDVTLFHGATAGDHSRAKYGERTHMDDLEDLNNAVDKFAYSLSVFKEEARSLANFEYADFIGLDFDGGTTIEEITNRVNALNYKASISETKSSRIEKNGITAERFRVIFQPSRRITDIDTFNNLWQFMYTLFPEADKACKNADRYFAKSKTAGVYLEGTTINLPAQLVINDNKKSENAVKISQITNNTIPPRIVLTKNVTYFLQMAPTGSLNGQFNTMLNKAAFDLARSGLPKNLSQILLEESSPQPFDEQDHRTFNSGWMGGEKRGSLPILGNVSKIPDDVVFDILESELKGKFLIMEDERGRRGQIIEVADDNSVKISSESKIISQISKILLERTGTFMITDKVKRHAEGWIHITEPFVGDIKPVGFKSEPGFAFHKLDFDPASGKSPIFDEFLARTTNNEELCAFIWSLFEPESDTQQYLWLYGDGGNGKSSLGDFLSQCLGSSYMSKNGVNAYNNKNFSSTLIGKRLAVFEDSNSTKFVQSGTFKELTGGGLVEVEAKYEHAYSTRLFVKFMFLSNFEPEISSKQADLRRLILCHVGPITGEVNPHYKQLLWEERSAILFKCQQAYNKLNNKGLIKVKTLPNLNIAADSELPFHAVFEEYLKPGSEIEALELYNLVKGGLKINGLSQKQFKDWLQREKCVTIKNNNNKLTYVGVSRK
jgi:hypothetical protein